MKLIKVLLIVAVIFVVVAIASVVYNSSNFTGFATTSTGEANLTVESATQIDFTTAFIDWESGRVTSGDTEAILDTSAGNISNGNWTPVTEGFVLENQGNLNLTIELAAGKTNLTFMGGTDGSYQWNVSNNETDSCSHADLGDFEEVNSSKIVCDQFSSITASNEIRIDLKLIIPEDSSTGALTDLITATATAA